jgi:hypothetical protein
VTSGMVWPSTTPTATTRPNGSAWSKPERSGSCRSYRSPPQQAAARVVDAVAVDGRMCRPRNAPGRYISRRAVRQ